MGRILAAIGTLILLGWAGPAAAASAIFYSDVDEFYGWAAGYAYSRAESEAHDACTGAGGKQCRFALSCNGGYGSVAFAADPAKGVGMSCGFTSSYTARLLALTSCMAVSRAICWTESTFDDDGDELPTSGNETFDTAWYAQQMLFVLDYDVGATDGEVGPQTRAALKSFQTSIGLAPDGELTIDLLWRLLNAVGGPQVMAKGLYAALIEPNLAEVSDRLYAQSSAPAPEMPYSEELATYAVEEQRLGLATLLSTWTTPCTLPARNVEAVPPDGSGGWHVECAEGNFTIIFDSASRTVMTGLLPITVNGSVVSIGGSDQPKTPRPQVPPTDKSGGKSLSR